MQVCGHDRWLIDYLRREAESSGYRDYTPDASWQGGSQDAWASVTWGWRWCSRDGHTCLFTAWVIFNGRFHAGWDDAARDAEEGAA